MNKFLLTLIIFLTFFSQLLAQQPQFVVVKPNGISATYATWDLAYTAATDGDNIYFPPITYNAGLTISKRLNIYGAGFHPDSTTASGKSIIMNNVEFSGSSAGSHLEGFQCNYELRFIYNQKKLKNITLKSNNLAAGVRKYDGSIPHGDSSTANIIFKENVIWNFFGTGINNNLLFEKNLFRAGIQGITQSILRNNTFANNDNYGNANISISVFENNIFNSETPLYQSSINCTNIYKNNFKRTMGAPYPFLAACSANAGIEIGTLYGTSPDDFFLNFDASFVNFPFQDNYHLKPTSPGKNAGTDFTDVGIYGTASPTPDGWIPSNPHIYYKTIAPETAPDGKLNIHVKVRTNN